MHFSLVVLYTSDFLFAGIRVLLDCWINFMSTFNVLPSWLRSVELVAVANGRVDVKCEA